ncbi:unnamed protein product [Urochloa humidicola]
METPRSFGTLLLALLLVIGSARPCRSSLYRPPPPAMVYHAGAVLDGAVPVSVLYYGAFSPQQKAVISDFLLSLSPRGGGIQHHHGFGSPGPAPAPSVARWWETVDRYVRKAGRRDPPRVVLAAQAHDAACSLGKTLSRLQVERLAARLGVAPGGVAVVLTAPTSPSRASAPAPAPRTAPPARRGEEAPPRTSGSATPPRSAPGGARGRSTPRRSVRAAAAAARRRWARRTATSAWTGCW